MAKSETSKNLIMTTGILFNHGRRLEEWNLIKTIPFKKNRAIFYHGSLFHSPPKDLFESRIIGKRITLDLFGDFT
jgi:hypothetical protein